ncbi:DNRLRE domain-containing protein [Sporolactobacillus sp. CPB3-1]|uniref:DNRLRE domain-containing protein n=1 Tax=Sporolactobacillus mangiferae TaxID=2940498 RepID=A0ABT0MD37_9BACL|nr:DNRLRE domain-containing protein [Sporolactobacillus mangiferae]MCL1632797.1 DNRLRE domain-containing protein [Sporolactobacillus mangiferae]
MFFTQLKKWLCTLLCATLIISLLPSVASADSAGSQKEKVHPSASTTANVNKKPQTKKELVSARDAYSKTLVDDTGQLTKEIYAEPIHNKFKGKWENISDKIVSDTSSDEMQTDATQLKVNYPKKLQKNKKIRYRFGSDTLTIDQIKAFDDSGEVSPNPSSKMEHNKNQLVYKDIFPGMDLRHISFNKEVKEDWILHEYKGIHQFEYDLHTTLNPHVNDDGSIGFYKDEAYKQNIFMMPRPIMEDSNINPGLGNGVKSSKVHYELEQTGDQSYKIRLIVDKDWLTSPDRVYPVYIDPSVTLNVLADTFISSAYPTTNYNKEWDSTQGEYVLKVGKYDSTTGTNYAFIKFAIVGELKGAIIDSANLNVYVTHSYYTTQKTGLWVDRANSYWNANQLTWNNRPSSTNITSTSVARDQWATLNVKSAVQGFVKGDYSNEGFKFHTNGNGQTYWKKITAGESANKAKLAISYHYPTMTNPSVTAAQNGIGQSTGYVNVSWAKADGASAYELQLFDGKGFETVYSGSGTSWTSKGKNIFPKAPYSSSSTYKLDGTGTELAVNPSDFFSAKSGTATTRKDYGFRVIAKYPGGNSPALPK